MCKACKAECPSNVDVAKLKAEYLQTIYRRRPRPLGDYLVANLPMLNRLSAPLAPLINWLGRRGLLRWGLETLAGIDQRRSLPPLHAWHFRRWFRWHRRHPQAGLRGRVLLLADCFTTYNEPAIGRAAVRLLERAGYRVELADVFCCGRTLISKGFLRSARTLIQFHAERLARRIADGTLILGMEPSCLLTLVDEWTNYFRGRNHCHCQSSPPGRQLARGALPVWRYHAGVQTPGRKVLLTWPLSSEGTPASGGQHGSATNDSRPRGGGTRHWLLRHGRIVWF